MDIKTLLATPRPLVKWLRTKLPTEVVGIGESPTSCPLARFLQSNGLGMIVLNHERAKYLNRAVPSQTYPLPPWASLFVVAIDELNEIEITAQRAIEILTQLFPKDAEINSDFIHQFLDDPCHFLRWLEEQQEDATVGEMIPGANPLARFLAARGVQSPNIMRETVLHSSPNLRTTQLPMWAIKFNQRLFQQSQRSVSAKVAIAVLKAVLDRKSSKSRTNTPEVAKDICKAAQTKFAIQQRPRHLHKVSSFPLFQVNRWYFIIHDTEAGTEETYMVLDDYPGLCNTGLNLKLLSRVPILATAEEPRR